MVTILPIDVNDDLVREGLQYAVAERVHARMKELERVVNELRAGGIIAREKWEECFAALAQAYAETTPVLDYAQVFEDQHPQSGVE